MKKKVIVFCEGKILHQELATSLAIRFLTLHYNVLAVIDRKSNKDFISIIDSTIPVFDTVKDALYEFRNIYEPIYLLLGMEEKNELILLSRENDDKSKTIN